MIGTGAGSHEGSPYGVNGAGVGGEQGGMCRCEHGEILARTFRRVNDYPFTGRRG